MENNTLEFTDEEWKDLLDWLLYLGDESYSNKIAFLIQRKIEEKAHSHKRG